MWFTPAPTPATTHPATTRTRRPARRPADVLSLVAILLAALLVLTLLPASAGSATPARAGDVIPDRILVTFEDGAPAAARASARRDARATELSRIEQLGVSVWQVPEHAAARALAGLQRNPHVAYAELDTRVELLEATTVAPNDPWFRFQWGTVVTRTNEAWSTTTGSRDVTIAVLDTGLTPSKEFEGKVLRGHNVLDGTTNVTDANGHGTRVASIAGAATGNGEGIAGYCWNCMLLPVKVMGSSGTMSDVAKGVVWAVDNGADVISMSLGGSSGSTAIQSAVRYAADRDVVLLAAAGNAGSTSPFYPAAYAEVIGVAGSTSDDTLYPWSNHGSWVDVSAPGQNQSIGTDGAVWGSSGTSSATPVVAGIVGLALSLDSQPTAAQVRGALNEGAVHIGSGVRYGRVDARNTVALLGGGSGTAPAPAPAPAPVPLAPTIAIGQPANGATVSGVVTVAGTARSNDSASITRVDVRVGGTTRTATGTTSWSTTVDTSGLPEGTTRITATATTSSGVTSSSSVDVVVSRPVTEPERSLAPAPAIDLRASGAKAKGVLTAQLAWNGSAASQVDVHVDGARAVTVQNSGSYTHRPSAKGNPTITYQVCERGSLTVCSVKATVSTW